MLKQCKGLFYILLLTCLSACDGNSVNNPYPAKYDKDNILYSVFIEQPKTLDPARSYSEDEAVFTGQTYEPPLQYHYLQRPYELEPLTAVTMPQVQFLDKDKQPLPDNAKDEDIVYSVYTIEIKPGIYYQPHPAFAIDDSSDDYIYHNLSKDQASKFTSIKDFKHTASRELTAEDYIYQIKRLASPKSQSPILPLMEDYIVGMEQFNQQLQQKLQQQPELNRSYLDLRDTPLEGVKLIDKYTYQIILKDNYPQFNYWLTMPFFAPVPWEADKLYSQAGMEQHNINFNWYPVGTGPYMLDENNPNSRMVLIKNPNFHGETYPMQGSIEDEMKGLLDDRGKAIPFIDKIIFINERESIPVWNKFLQGYYDRSGIGSDNFDTAIEFDELGEAQLTPALQNKDIQLRTSVSSGIFYLGFNMLDNVVGGYDEQAQKLRQAIAIALDYEEFVSIFMNGRGIPAQSILAPGIFGYLEDEAGINPYVYDWVDGQRQRKSLAYAKQLLAQAGYPNGINSKTGKPLVLNFDAVASAGSDERARFAWMRKRLAKLGIQLHVRATQYNRFQDKMRSGNAQLFFWGWRADYPDPENFLFLLYGPHGKVEHGGENHSNYNNAEYDKLFDVMKSMPNGPERQAVIDDMVEIIRKDSPMVWGFYPKTFQLSHSWAKVGKASDMIRNTLKYSKVDPQLRAEKRAQWNTPYWRPLLYIVLLLLIIISPVVWQYWCKEHKPKPKLPRN